MGWQTPKNKGPMASSRWVPRWADLNRSATVQLRLGECVSPYFFSECRSVTRARQTASNHWSLQVSKVKSSFDWRFKFKDKHGSAYFTNASFAIAVQQTAWDTTESHTIVRTMCLHNGKMPMKFCQRNSRRRFPCGGPCLSIVAKS